MQSDDRPTRTDKTVSDGAFSRPDRTAVSFSDEKMHSAPNRDWNMCREMGDFFQQINPPCANVDVHECGCHDFFTDNMRRG